MKKVEGFWGSLEVYFAKVIERAGLPRYWRWMAVGIVLVVIVSSAASAKSSVAGETSLEGVVEKATILGDYTTAREYWSEAQSELEDMVYPERKVERRIEALETKLLEYPGNRQIYLGLVQLYVQIVNSEKAEEYRERARVLDPNGNEYK